MNPSSQRLILLLLLMVAAGVFGMGINWGLPSREEDRFLLGSDYHGMHLEPLTAQVPEVDANRAADVVAPAGPADQVVTLNDTNLKKAQILCRYRLYSFQPDEMITFRSLSQMKPGHGDFDPRLYQYGGLWIYPVGAIIEAGHLLGFLDIGDRALYIGNPEIFGKFYIAARAYSAAWGLIGVWAVFVLIRRISGENIFLATVGALCFIFMPVVVDMAHEAKPHLAGCVLILLAVLAGDNYLRSKRMRWLWITGLLCGAAAGMVLWGIIGLILLPVIATQAKRPVLALYGTLAAIAFYAMSNPYVIFHLLHDPSVLRSNLGNTSAMYQLGRPDQAIWNAVQLVVAGTGTLVFAAGLIGVIVLIRCQKQTVCTLLFAAAAATAIPFAVMAAGKPGEYARFALLPDVALAIAAISWLTILKSPILRGSLAVLIAAAMACYGLPYVVGFVRDSMDLDHSTRYIVAEAINRTLKNWKAIGADHPKIASLQARQWRLGVYSDPAPYCLPPVDLDGWTIVRLPRNYDEANGRYAADLIVRPDETLNPWLPGQTPISWANKHFQLIEGGAYDVWEPGDPISASFTQPPAASNVEPPAASNVEP